LKHLYSEAIRNKDWALGQLILIGAYTGARIEEICSLKKLIINLENKSIQITDAKTEAGLRDIPIHQMLLPVVNELMSNNDEYLIANLTKSKFDDRSNAIGKRFGRLKAKLGYSKRHVFHSIRKTFTTQLENAGVNENITADIIGHEKPRMTYGLYSGGTNIEVKREAISKVSYDFQNPITN
jgi:integrase